ncbi:amidase [Stappia sp. GBMRC 2046]|uniref:Amidase n=1 Tax=Stappia sediminis TaxID=2692190 RepID=A0A7X3S5T8_9HYPH|nr:amidase [Stappia sediminis]MXN63478.1 amidase [Stappia sediminis]
MLSAVKLAREIEAGTTSVRAVFETCAAAIAEREETISAFTHQALDQARKAAENGHGPLMGLPLAVKDNLDTADMPTAYGSQIYEGRTPAADAAVVALARRLGAGIIGKTVTTEFAFFEPGPTRNPWNPLHTPGGSSSGSAAGIAAGFFPLSLGTQTGGSVVRPASFCGIAGFKPTFGRLPREGLKIFSWSLDTIGVFGKGVEDAAFGAAALSGRNWRVDGASPAAPHIAVVHSHLWKEASGEMRQAVETAARLAEKAGAKVSTVELPGIFSDAFAAHQVIQDYEAALALGFEFDRHNVSLSQVLRETLAAGREIPPDNYDIAQDTARKARQNLAGLFKEFDVILTPSAPGAAPSGLGSTGSSIFNRLWTLMGVPCVNVPGLMSANHLPLGVQIVGPYGEDRKTLLAALWLEGLLRKQG